MACFACSALTDRQCADLMPVFDGLETPKMAILWRSFAPPAVDKCVRKFMSRYWDKPHTVAIHFQNGPGRRNERLSRYELFPNLSVGKLNAALERRDPKTLRAIRKEARRIVEWVADRAGPNTTIELSTGLEDNYSSRAFTVLVAALKKSVPKTWTLYRNPVGENEKPHTYHGASFIELHGYEPKFTNRTRKRGECSYSNDGIDIDLGISRPIEPYVFLPQMRTYIRRARANKCRTWIWWGAVQGLEGGRGFTHPRGRNFRVLPSDIDLLNQFLRSFENENSN